MTRMNKFNIVSSIILAQALWLASTGWAATPVGSGVTYQGDLRLGDTAVHEPMDGCDFEFRLWDDAVLADPENQVGSTLSQTLLVADGMVTTTLDFGSDIFTGKQALWLEIAVCCPASCMDFTTLSPRQALTPAPQALALPSLYTSPGTNLEFDAPNIIGGLPANSVADGVSGATISGGGHEDYPNVVAGTWGTVSGGMDNIVSSDRATVAGGSSNTAIGFAAAVGGGLHNTADGPYATIGGGLLNTNGPFATIGGGGDNIADGLYATIGGGEANATDGDSTTVGGGRSNTASADGSTVAGGLDNTASGLWSAIPGGFLNQAGGVVSFAAGHRAIVRDASQSGNEEGDKGTFIWADSLGEDFVSTGQDQFLIRAAGGVGIGTNAPNFALHVMASGSDNGIKIQHDGVGTSPQVRWTDQNDTLRAAISVDPGDTPGMNLHVNGADRLHIHDDGNIGIGTNFPSHPLHLASGAHVTAGGTWTNSSSRHLKENFVPVDPESVLARVSQLPISSWNYKNEDDSIKHIGPIAEDFHAAFGLGGDDTSIGTVDSDGVSLAAIQALHINGREQEMEIKMLQNRLTHMEALVAKLLESSCTSVEQGGAQ